MRERTVEVWFKHRVEATGGITRKTQWVGRWGCPDRWCGWPTTKRSAWVELKGDGGVISVHQQNEMARLRGCGEKVVVLATIQQVEAFVSEMSGIPLAQDTIK